MVQSSSGTLIKPPAIDPSKSQIENVLELTPITDIGPDIYTNTRPLWHPPGARGIYGGAAIAQSLAAAQATIPPPSASNGHSVYLVHSMHCYFVLAGDASIPVLYHVERVREGRSFMTRTVQARQRGKCIFTTTLSFVREGSAGRETVGHEAKLPQDALEELEEDLKREESEEEMADKAKNGEEQGGPFLSKRLGTYNNSSPLPHTKRTRSWVRAKGRISPAGGLHAHLSALAYMSDSYFIGTVARVQNLWRFGRPMNSPAHSRIINSSPDNRPTSSTSSSNAGTNNASTRPPHQLEMAEIESLENSPESTRRIGMMVSLDHTIFFHRPRDIRADEWLFSQMQSPWAGDGRGLVLQRIWNRRGELVATCVQEGLVRLAQGGEKGKL